MNISVWLLTLEYPSLLSVDTDRQYEEKEEYAAKKNFEVSTKFDEKQTYLVVKTFEATTIFSSIGECSTDCSSEQVLFSSAAANRKYRLVIWMFE